MTDSPSKPSVLSDTVHTFKEPSSPLNATIRAVSQFDASPLATQPKQIKVLSSPSQSLTAANSTGTKVVSRSEVKVEPRFDEVTKQGRAGMMVGIPGFEQLANKPTLHGATTTTTAAVHHNISDVGATGQNSSMPAAQTPPSTQICSTPQRPKTISGKFLTLLCHSH